jgi:hypothetical protein
MGIMPFKSEAQRKYLHANQPKLAQEWEQKYPVSGQLPERAKPSKKVNLGKRRLFGKLVRK